jgi:pSer/pThr/pTyr-binding forkhead associated (FHA) protein
MDVRLRVVGGPFSGQTLPVFRGKLLIGRAEDCDVRPDSEFVSGYHCVLLVDDYTLRVRDLGSRNGTLVNGRRIGSGVTILLHDDMISIGEMNILVDLSQVTAGEAGADSETHRQASLEGTGVYDGDTLQADIADVIPQPPPPVSSLVNPNVLPPPSDDSGSRQ